MAAEVFQDEVEILVPNLEAVPFGVTTPVCYPLPELCAGAPPVPRKFQTVILENSFLRATLLPELGGRIISLFDKRTNVECLSPYEQLELTPEPRRGVWLPQGIQWQIGEPIRRQSMAEVDIQIVEGLEDDSARIVLFELVAGLELSWHLWMTLPSDRTELLCEIRAQNRGLSSIPYGAGLSLGLPVDFEAAQGVALFERERRAGVVVLSEPGSTDSITLEHGASFLRREGVLGRLEPRQTDHWTFTIMPVSGLGGVSSFGPGGSLEIRSDAMSVQAGQRVAGAKLFLLTSLQGTLEATVDLHPETITSFDQPEGAGQLEALVLRNATGDELLRWPLEAMPSKPSQPDLVEPIYLESAGPTALARARRSVPLRAPANVVLAMKSIASERWTEADERLEEALLFNGDDPLSWWLRAAVARHSSNDGEAALANAHYLAPMEPLLRVEAFFSQPEDPQGRPNAMVARLAENPERLTESASRLLQAGLLHDAARLLEEALRHVEAPVLRLLSAWIMLQSPHLRSEAAIHVGKADAMEIGPPFPWRQIEWRALHELKASFPDNEMIRKLLERAPERFGTEVS